MFFIFVLYKCIKEKVKPNIIALLFLFIIDVVLLCSLIGVSNVRATDDTIYYSSNRSKQDHSGGFVYYSEQYCPIRIENSSLANYNNAGYWSSSTTIIPAYSKDCVDLFYRSFPQYFTDEYMIIFNISTDYSDWGRCLVIPKDNLVSITATLVSPTDSANGININGINYNYSATGGVKQYKTNYNSPSSYAVENWNNSGTWYCNSGNGVRISALCWNATIPLTNDLSSFRTEHQYTYLWDDNDYFNVKPSFFNTYTDLQYMRYDKLEILLNGSPTQDLTFMLFECDSSGNALTELEWFFELSNLNENSPYYWSTEENSGFDIPYYDFADVDLKSGHYYNWFMTWSVNDHTYTLDNVVLSNVTWNSGVGVNNALINSQTTTSNTIQNQTEWQQQSASGDFNVSNIASPSFDDPTQNITNLFNNVVSAISNWEAEPLVLKIPRSENGHSTSPYVVTINGNYVEESLKWMFTTYDDMSVNPSHSGFIVINIIQTIWWFVFGRWVYRIIRRIIDDIRSGKILDHNIEDITSDML